MASELKASADLEHYQPFFFLLTFLLLQAQTPLHRVCCLPFMPCLFLGLMGPLRSDYSKLDLRPSDRPTLTRTPPPHTPASNDTCRF
jgi:hypothetical protein